MRFFRRRSLAQRLASGSQTVPQQSLCRVHIDRGGVFIVQLRHPQVTAQWSDRLLHEQRQQVMKALNVSPELIHDVLVIADGLSALSAPNMCYLSQLDDFLKTYSMPLFQAREVRQLIDRWRRQQPRCEHCNTAMQLQIRQHGSFAGTVYFSCGNFPRCRQLKPVN